MPGEMIPIVLFICIVAIVKIVIDANLKRKVLEMGTIDDNAQVFLNTMAYNDPSSIKWGMVLIAAGAVILLTELIPFHISDQTVIGGVLAAAGIAFIVHYFWAARQSPASAS